MNERTLVILKPDAVKRGLTGKITERLESKGLKLVASKMEVLSSDILKTHYSHLVSKPFFPEIEGFMSSGPVILQVWEGKNSTNIIRLMLGITNSAEAMPGTIRGDLAMSKMKNLMHASETPEIAIEEVKRFFDENEIYSYSRDDEGSLDDDR